MFCDKCQKVFDLDSSFFPDSEVEGGPRVAHHESYMSLCRAALSGCEFCQLLIENHRGGNQEISSPILPGSKWQVTVQFSHDSIIVNIPMRINYGECEQDVTAENYDLGEDNIKLYISTDHGQLSGRATQSLAH
jgi:hypothetical protein